MRILIKKNTDLILNFFLAGAAAALLIGMCLGMIGTGAAGLVKPVDFTHAVDAARFKIVAAIPKPALAYQDNVQWEAGDAVTVSQAFSATDHAGNGLAIRVLAVHNAGGEDLTPDYRTDTDSIRLEDAGVYYFKLRAMDSNKKVVTEEIPLVVDAAG